MRNTNLLIAALMAVAVVSDAAYADHTNFYGALVAGQSNQSIDENSIGTDFKDTNAVAVGVTAGYNVTHDVAVELSYLHNNKRNFATDWGANSMGWDLNSEIVSATGVYNVQIGEYATVFARAGGAWHKVTMDDWHKTYLRPTWGVGVKVPVAEGVSLRFSYDDYLDAGQIGRHMDTWRAGVQTEF